MEFSKDLGADAIEIHTGAYCNLFNKHKNINFELKKIKKAALFAKNINLNVHAGHGLTFESIKKISKIKHISEFNIGHFLIAESIFISLKKAILRFKKLIKG